MNDGITRRDLFIAAALQGLLAHHGSEGSVSEEDMTVFAFRYGNQTELQVLDAEEDEAALDRAAAARLRDELREQDEAAAKAERNTFYANAGAHKARWATPPAPEQPGNAGTTEG